MMTPQDKIIIDGNLAIKNNEIFKNMMLKRPSLFIRTEFSDKILQAWTSYENVYQCRRGRWLAESISRYRNIKTICTCLYPSYI